MPPKQKKQKKETTPDEKVRLLARELGYRLVKLFTNPEWSNAGGQYDEILRRAKELLISDKVFIEALSSYQKQAISLRYLDLSKHGDIAAFITMIGNL